MMPIFYHLHLQSHEQWHQLHHHPHPRFVNASSRPPFKYGNKWTQWKLLDWSTMRIWFLCRLDSRRMLACLWGRFCLSGIVLGLLPRWVSCSLCFDLNTAFWVQCNSLREECDHLHNATIFLYPLISEQHNTYYYYFKQSHNNNLTDSSLGPSTPMEYGRNLPRTRKRTPRLLLQNMRRYNLHRPPSRMVLQRRKHRMHQLRSQRSW